MKRLSWIAAAAALAACVSVPPPEAEMRAARAAVAHAQAAASKHAAGELRAAQAKLERAEVLYGRGQYVDARVLAEEAEADAKLALARAESERTRRELEERVAEAQRRASESRRQLEALKQARAAVQAERLAEAEALGSAMRGLDSRLPEIEVRESGRGWELAIVPGVLFEEGEADLKPGGRRALDSVARVLRRHPQRNVLIETYASEAGGADLNERLARRRAHAVRNALVLAGVDGARIAARGTAGPPPEEAQPVQIVVAPAPDAAAGATPVDSTR